MATEDLSDYVDTVPQTGLRLSLTTSQTYTKIQKGELRAICRNGRWFVSKSSVEAYLRRHAAPTAA